ncbi:substrate-binding domain-containing protein [Humisphaera borealis]|uniref:Substrate-binding domain-containing protein n=1 Tax=Humisphaera borealis TaxID=2807512 RepID=A0A7M2WZN3_9BACT|nr:substrate-binding domain-containing protein [Humisphaera borealis]QOV90652.1 substrate-binding domain-containing protein [Humisphaera borealis]
MQLELEWPFKRHAGIFAGTQKYAGEHSWQSIVDENPDATLQKYSGNPASYDGIIARATGKLARRAARANIPVVNVWLSSPAAASLPGVFPDYSAQGRLRAEHLLTRGFSHFAALTADENRGESLELEAFTNTVREAGYRCASAKVSLDAFSGIHWRRTERTIATWMSGWKRPIGIYIGTELLGRVVAQACHNRGWRVPEDVAIIAGRNEEMLCESLHPTLSSMEVGYDHIGYEAARLLDRLMNGEPPPRGPILIPPEGVVVRESTDFFAVDDPLIAAALRFIAANSHLEIGQDDVARAVDTGSRTLQRRFQKHLKRPIAAEIRRVRIERAKRELAQGSLPLKEIARKVGFGETMQMYTVFRRDLGVTPSQYRKDRENRQT